MNNEKGSLTLVIPAILHDTRIFQKIGDANGCEQAQARDFDLGRTARRWVELLASVA